jgi:hypothetical protein
MYERNSSSKLLKSHNGVVILSRVLCGEGSMQLSGSYTDPFDYAQGRLFGAKTCASG